ncbi:hypothetical protein BH09MYX1_BH09MYX1_27740 [soil metagenome]
MVARGVEHEQLAMVQHGVSVMIFIDVPVIEDTSFAEELAGVNRNTRAGEPLGDFMSSVSHSSKLGR